ncbi:hypothetical protein [Streptomyces pseudovenezuelae]|uniref:hypothetical protein n=1 Tax=Streptomyces pseudovenezuelae TaxID=67350 RepID=UPI0024753004|nr:hypothetical protein [Streptomyces pseudovenezuelae]
MRGRGPVLSAAAVTLLLAGCTNGQADEDATRESDTSAAGGSSASPSPSATTLNEPYTLAEADAPKTRTEATAFVRGLTVRPDYFGSGYRKRDPYEAGPFTWAVLGDDCLWRREAIPNTVLASLTRSFIRPGTGGEGAVYVSLTVTVHTSTREARRDMAMSLEEPLRCPQQRLNATDVVQDMTSRGDPFGEQRTGTSDDDLSEYGQYVVDGAGKARRFDWYKHRLGPVTVAATVRHPAGAKETEQTTVTEAALGGVDFVTADVDRIGKSEDGTDADASGEAKGSGDE